MKKLLLLGFLCWFGKVFAQTDSENIFHHRYYFGGMGGYGSTTWNALVPRQTGQNSALSISTPTEVGEGGAVWGLAAGYEFIPCFALELNYMQFPDATIMFDEYSLFAFDNDGITNLNTKTETVSLNAKLMLHIPHTKSLRAFSSVGVAAVIRKDQINETNRISPTFGFGINFLPVDRVMIEIGSNYTAGYGESEINPVEDYVPFLYSVFGKVTFRLG
ncbi:MAG: hypothetical protein NXI01_01130 [Gammaproteobacteria bacterium]|nr:hypothetical protein [Gammaproteobacteria bacterium]